MSEEQFNAEIYRLSSENSKLRQIFVSAANQLHEASARGKWEMVAMAENILRRVSDIDPALASEIFEKSEDVEP